MCFLNRQLQCLVRVELRTHPRLRNQRTGTCLILYATQAQALLDDRGNGTALARRRMRLLRDVLSVSFSEEVDYDAGQTVRAAVQRLFGLGLVEPGDRLLLTHGDQIGSLGGTNTLKLLSVGPNGDPEILRALDQGTE